MKLTSRDFLKMASNLKTNMRPETKKKFVKVIELRLNGHSLEAIAKHLDLAKSRIFKLENVLVGPLRAFEYHEYKNRIQEGKEKLTSIK